MAAGERRRRRLRRADGPQRSRDTGAPAGGDDPAPGTGGTPSSTGTPPGGEAEAGAAPQAARSSAGRGRNRGAPPPPPQHRPSPADLAELAGPFALTAAVHDPEPAEPPADRYDDTANGERGLRGLVGSGSSQVDVVAAMRARDASRPSDEDLARAEAELPIVRRGWVPRDELPRPGRHRD